MNDLKADVARMQNLVSDAFSKTGALAALADGGIKNPERLQMTLESTAGQFEKATLELRRMCERYAPGTGGYAYRPPLKCLDVSGTVETIGYSWLHIRVNTLLPSCRYQTPSWLTDTIIRLLNEYESGGSTLPYFNRALLIIQESSDIQSRRVFDQDNKSWKAVSNAIKGRLIPDDDQYTLGIVLLGCRSGEDACDITLLDRADAGDFFTAQPIF